MCIGATARRDVRQPHRRLNDTHLHRLRVVLVKRPHAVEDVPHRVRHAPGHRNHLGSHQGGRCPYRRHLRRERDQAPPGRAGLVDQDGHRAQHERLRRHDHGLEVRHPSQDVGLHGSHGAQSLRQDQRRVAEEPVQGARRRRQARLGGHQHQGQAPQGLHARGAEGDGAVQQGGHRAVRQAVQGAGQGVSQGRAAADRHDHSHAGGHQVRARLRACAPSVGGCQGREAPLAAGPRSATGHRVLRHHGGGARRGHRGASAHRAGERYQVRSPADQAGRGGAHEGLPHRQGPRGAGAGQDR